MIASHGLRSLDWTIIGSSVDEFLTFILIIIVGTRNLASLIINFLLNLVSSFHHIVSLTERNLSRMTWVSRLRSRCILIRKLLLVLLSIMRITIGIVELICHLFKHIRVSLQLALSLISLLKMIESLVDFIFLSLLALCWMHHLQLTFRMINCSSFYLVLFVSWLIFQSAATSIEIRRLCRWVDGLLIDGDLIRTKSFFVAYSSNIGLISDFIFIIKMWVTFHILKVLLFIISISSLNASLKSHGTTRPLFQIDSNIAASTLWRVPNRCLLMIENLIIMNTT
jgi:hypothetical protein